MIDFETQLTAPTRIATNSVDDEELGFLPLLAAAIPMVTSLAGSLMSKSSSKTGGPPPEAGQANKVLDVLTKAIGEDPSKGEMSIKDVVRNIVATVPSPVIGQVKAALNELKLAQQAGAQSRAVLVNAVDSKFGPQLHAMLAALKAGQLQKQATYEHNRIKARDKSRRETKDTLLLMAKKLDRIEKRLNSSAIVQGNTRISLLGGRGLLER